MIDFPKPLLPVVIYVKLVPIFACEILQSGDRRFTKFGAELCVVSAQFPHFIPRHSVKRSAISRYGDGGPFFYWD